MLTIEMPANGADSLHLGEDELDRYLTGPMPANRLDDLGEHMEACAVCRRSLASSLARRRAPARTHLHSSDQERRRDPRFGVDDTVILRVLRPFSASSLAARLLDVSKHGMRLSVPVALSEQSVVQIRTRNSVILAHVRYCVPRDGAFHAGLHIAEFNRHLEGTVVAV